MNLDQRAERALRRIAGPRNVLTLQALMATPGDDAVPGCVTVGDVNALTFYWWRVGAAFGMLLGGVVYAAVSLSVFALWTCVGWALP